jgi:vanillate O-demethylase ferredoxin subunit
MELRMTMESGTLEVRLKAITFEAEGINGYVLEPLTAGELPPFTAGAHIDVHMPGGMIRSYSLVNNPEQRNRYVLGVARDPASRGGSVYMHESLRVGSKLKIGLPRNNFPLNEAATRSVLIAGGIGITPMYCMLQHLQTIGRPWTLYYCARSHAHAAFLSEIEALARATPTAKLHLHFDDEAQGKHPDIAAMVASAEPDAHLYCCGPAPMLDAFTKAAASRHSDTVHVEYFSAREEAATDGGFTVKLARSGKTIPVSAGKTILDALLDAGIDAQYGCMQGVCGSCETRVLAGVPDHRDGLLDEAARNSNTTIMICCSGSKTPELTLDL